MKYLPRKFRESQSDWFAKRGIFWHVSVVLRRVDGALQTLSFIHVVENCSQDSWVVTRIMQHVLMCLKQDNPELKEAFYRQDNAGCYQSVPTILCCEQLSSITGVKISRCDFSDPQGGKGPCDRLAATAKAHVNLYINEGHDVTNAKELTGDLLSNGGMEAVRPAHVDAGAQTSVPPGSECKLDGISYHNNFQFGKEGLTA